MNTSLPAGAWNVESFAAAAYMDVVNEASLADVNWLAMAAGAEHASMVARHQLKCFLVVSFIFFECCKFIANRKIR